MLKIEKYELYDNGQERRLFISKGKTFQSSNKKIVFILHDAQNFFDKKYTKYGNSFNILDALNKLNITNYLVAGLECDRGFNRYREYSPVPLRDDLSRRYKIKKEEIFGSKYIDSIKDKLIPDLENKMNFKFNKVKKYLIGSSMGGVITTYAAFKYPQLFNGYLAFSNALFANYPYIHDFINTQKKIGNYFHSMGGNEETVAIASSQEYIEAFNFLNDKLSKVANKNTIGIFIPHGEHSEKDWACLLPSAIKWILSNK